MHGDFCVKYVISSVQDCSVCHNNSVIIGYIWGLTFYNNAVIIGYIWELTFYNNSVIIGYIWGLTFYSQVENTSMTLSFL